MLQRLTPAHRTNFRLMLGFFVSLVLYLVFYGLLAVQGSDLLAALALSFHGVPFLLLQCRLCRAEQHRWVRWLPLALTGIVAGIGSLYFFGVLGTGWDFLGGGILLLLCIAPSVGIALGWIAAGTARERIAGAIWMALFAVCYTLMVVFLSSAGPADLIALLYVLLGIGLFLHTSKGRKAQPESAG